MQTGRVTFNGKRGGLSVARPWINALNDARLTTEKGGFLFKVSFDGDHIMLAAVPTLICNERSYHYNLRLDREDLFTLFGDVNAHGVFTILFKPESLSQLHQQAETYVELFQRLALFFREAGYCGEGRLDEVTQETLTMLGVVPPPDRLDALLQQA
jgi:hypothetical protein